MNINIKEKYVLFVPVLLALIFALVITFTNEYPLSWDIYTHINYALAYLTDGITKTDYLLNAPTGKTIGYPPLFHFVLILVSAILRSDLVNGARFLQIFLVVGNVFTISYVASKIHNEKTGLFAGLILISSFMFTRMFLPIPETLAMIFFTFAVYTYYKSTVDSSYVYALLSAILSILTLLTHFSSFVYLMVLLVVLMLVQTVNLKNYSGIKYYIYVMIPIIIMGILGLVVLFMVNSSYLLEVLRGVVGIIDNPFNLFMGQIAMGLERYIKCVGLLPLIFAIFGLYYSFKNKEFYFISLWSLVAFLFTNLHWFGVPVYTFRMLLYLIVPMVILGGYAITNLYDYIKTVDKKYSTILIILLIILSVGLCTIHLSDPSVTIFNANTEYSTYQIAPPTSEEQDLINYFKNEENNGKSILINNLYLGTVISSVDEIPLHYGFDVYTNKSLSKSSLNSLNEEKIGYIVYDKSLVINNTTYEQLDVQFVNGSYYPTYYFTNEITDDNFYTIQLPSTEKTFENERFIVCKVI